LPYCCSLLGATGVCAKNSAPLATPTTNKRGCKMLRAILLSANLILLIGCEKMASDACPTLYGYNDEIQQEAADQLEALPDGSALVVMMGHYGVNRNQIRVCRGGG